MGPRDFNGMYRDNEEEFHLADGTTPRRLEKGEPSKATMCQHNLNVNYSLQASENSLSAPPSAFEETISHTGIIKELSIMPMMKRTW